MLRRREWTREARVEIRTLKWHAPFKASPLSTRFLFGNALFVPVLARCLGLVRTYIRATTRNVWLFFFPFHKYFSYFKFSRQLSYWPSSWNAPLVCTLARRPVPTHPSSSPEGIET